MKKLLVFEPNYLGDILMTIPALKLLRKSFTDADIIALIDDKYQEAVSGYVNTVITKKGKIGLIGEIKSIKPDIAVLLRTTFSSAFICRLAGVKKTVGVDTEFSGLFLNKYIKYDKKRPFYKEYVEIVNLLKPVNNVSYDLEFAVNENDKSYIPALFKEYGIKPDEKYIVIAPGTTRKAKMWPVENYIGLINELKDYRIIITGSKREIRLAEKIRTPKVVSLAGKTNINRLASLLSNAELVISPDSGTLFLAVAVGAGTVGLFGSTDPMLYGPYKENTVIMYNKPDCGPCYKVNCPKGFPAPCLSKIKVDEVTAICKTLLKKT